MKRLIITSWIIVGSLLLLFIAYGYIRDVEGITGKTYVEVIFWWTTCISVIVAIILSIKTIIADISIRKLKVVKGILVVSFIFVIFLTGWLVGIVEYNSVYKDYISTEWIRGVTFDELKQIANNNDENVIYIGRNDCKECKIFEEDISIILEKNEVEITGYYTNLDRDGEKSREMYQWLDRNEIDSVPMVIVTTNGNLKRTFCSNDLKAIERYFDQIFN